MSDRSPAVSEPSSRGPAPSRGMGSSHVEGAGSPGAPGPGLDRRAFMGYFSAAGLGGTLFPGVLWARVREARPAPGSGRPSGSDARGPAAVGPEAQEVEVTAEMVAEAEKLAGLSFTPEEREMMLEGLQRNLESYRSLRETEIPNSVPPAVQFQVGLPGRGSPVARRPFRMTREPDVRAPDDPEEAAFWPVTRLSELVRSGRMTSVALTRMYLDRLKRHGPTLECVVTLTEDLALEQARRADDELARGVWRGPLHGIPWGGKDLLAVRGYPTTWGAEPYREQAFDEDATVVRRLEEAGAVLVAKTTLGALAMGDVWFGGKTKNPWNLEEGSSGSSAGSASATVAGLVGFSIGSETLGSIVSPSTRCGATGLRPTYGRVPRTGAMALSWSMDKLGPICRSVEDCALVLDAIHGSDHGDPTAREVPFDWDAERPLSDLRVGYFRAGFQDDDATEFDRRALSALRRMGVQMVPVSLPEALPTGALRIILSAEAGAAFDALTRSGRDDLLTRQDDGAWPNSFRRSRMIPAVEYIQANRVRTMLMGAVEAALDDVDVFVTPSYAGGVLLTTNLTGHPVLVLPNGFQEDGTPVSLSFVGGLWKEAEALRLAKAYQDETGFHLRRPPRFA